MLLGRDDVILNVCPAYRTDALLRKVNLDRYDDRVIVQTNLIESYGLLMQFAEKHLWDKFYLEGDARVSLRNVIAREVLANTLIHREFTSPYFAKFVIEKDRMYTENANRAVTGGLITPENFEPNSKNPVIAAFFRNIWLADELGSGVRRLHYYVPRYSGKPPEFIDGDVFRIVVPLDDGYSFEVEDNKVQLKRKIKRIGDDCALTENAVLEYLRNNPYATQIEVAAAIGKSRRTVQDSIAGLKEGGKLKREGAKKNGAWVVERRTEHKKISNHKPLDESPDYLREQIITYIGNKRALIPLIQEALSHIQAELDKPKLITADVFSGSGIVARLLKGYSEYLLANDIEGYADTINRCYLSNAGERDAAELRREYEKLRVTLGGDLAPGFITRLYAPEDDGNIRPGERVFYTLRNAKYIDTARQAIGRMDKEIQHYFLAPLLYEASVKTNTAGVFKGFYKNSATGLGQYGGNGKNALKRITADIELPFPVFSRYDCEVCATKRLAEELAGELRGFDVVYIDPPYNQHPYGSNYFMLNLINDYQEPAEYSRVSGIPREWNRSRFNNKRSALEALSEICAAVGSKYLLISFNSEGFITRDEMEEMLSRFGDLHIYEQQYNTFRGSRNLSNRSIHLHEYLYLLRMRG
jgi:adenine-specific DNA-methyltransferase